MKRGYLSEYFVEIAYKRLSAVEASRQQSNQHEFDGISSLRRMLGPERRRFNAKFVYLCDEGAEPTQDDGVLTWYDAREAHPKRSEYRLYFPETRVSERAEEDDLLVIARQPDGTLLVVIADAQSSVEAQIIWLFGLRDLERPGFLFGAEADADKRELDLASRAILEHIGVEPARVDETHLVSMRRAFDGAFPTTTRFSEYARSTLPEVTALDDPDDAIVAWIEREEVLFRTLERYIISDRLHAGFRDDVEGFLAFSLSVQNRRKSRAGRALENHLEYLFRERKIHHSRTAPTEGRSKPDFLFPGNAEYHDSGFSAARLTMLGVKSSCKDRWRQILAEADRIAWKHLLTLEPSISENQTDEMISKRVQLVVPLAIQKSYSDRQRMKLIKVADFIKLVSDKQHVPRKAGA